MPNRPYFYFGRRIDMPKKFSTPFMIFCKEQRPVVNIFNPQDAVRELAARWRALEDKTEYEQRSQADKMRWRAQMRLWKRDIRRRGY